MGLRKHLATLTTLWVISIGFNASAQIGSPPTGGSVTLQATATWEADQFAADDDKSDEAVHVYSRPSNVVVFEFDIQSQISRPAQIDEADLHFYTIDERYSAVLQTPSNKPTARTWNGLPGWSGDTDTVFQNTNQQGVFGYTAEVDDVIDFQLGLNRHDWGIVLRGSSPGQTTGVYGESSANNKPTLYLEWRYDQADPDSNSWPFVPNGIIDDLEIHELVKVEAGGWTTYDSDWDADYDGDVDVEDRRLIYRQAMIDAGNTPTVDQDFVRGDVNYDGVFNSSDLVIIWQAGEYEDGPPTEAIFSSYAEGDMNGDRNFTSSDLVKLFQEGNYQLDATPGDDMLEEWEHISQQ